VSELLKGDSVVMASNKYHICFTETCSQPISLKNYEESSINKEQKESVLMFKQNTIHEAEVTATKILCEAKEKADNIIQEAIKEKEEKYKRGYEEGLKKAEQETKEALERINESFLDLLKTKKEIIENSAQEVLNLALCISQRILNEKITLCPDSVRLCFERAIDDIVSKGYEIVCIRLNKTNIDKFYPSWEIEDYMIKIKHDPRLSDTSCIVETDTGDIDIGMMTQYEEISCKLLSFSKHE